MQRQLRPRVDVRVVAAGEHPMFVHKTTATDCDEPQLAVMA
jgi:hypothetical protein